MMKASVRFADSPEFMSTPFSSRQREANGTPNFLNALGISQTPSDFSPSLHITDDDSDRVKLAGRTPHNKLAESSKNVEYLMNNLFSQSPYVSNSLNISVISPESASETSIILSSKAINNSDDRLFSPQAVVRNAVSIKTPMIVSPEHNETNTLEVSPDSVVAIRIAAPVADKMSLLMPDRKIGNDGGRAVTSTPHFERPRIAKGTPFAFARSGSVSPTTSEKSLDENESPNRVSGRSSEEQRYHVALFEPSPLPSNCDLDRSIIAELVYNESLLEFAVTDSPQSVAPTKYTEPEPAAVSVSVVGSVEPVRLKEQPHSLAHTESTKTVTFPAVPVHYAAPKADEKKQDAPVSSLFGSPALLRRAGGVAKGRGPASSAAAGGGNKKSAPAATTEKEVVVPVRKNAVSVNASPLSETVPVARVERKVPDLASAVLPASSATEFIGLPEAQSLPVNEMHKVAIEIKSVETMKVDCVAAAKSVPNTCNVSIQCSSLDDIYSAADAARQSTFSQHMQNVLTERDDSFVSNDAAPQERAYSPMFTSYYRTQHESDSEDDAELGLFDLLQSSPSASSARLTSTVTGSTAKVLLSPSVSNSSFRSTAAVLGSARRVTLQEQRQTALEADEEDDLCMDFADSDDGQILLSDYSWPRHQSDKRASQPVQVQHRPEFDSSECNVGIAAHHFASQQRSATLDFSLFATQEDGDFSVSVHDHTEFNDTLATDVAVKFTNESVYDSEMYSYSVESNNAVEDPDVSLSLCQGAETTMTLDQSPLVNIELDGLQQACPHLNIMSMKREKNAAPDVKEITLQASPGAFVTTVLHFSNRHRKLQTLRSNAIPIRFEPSSGVQGGESSSNYFSLSPSELNILPGEDSQLFITFSPSAAGIYTGAVKIKSGQKTFLMLLRGEAAASTSLVVQEQKCRPPTLLHPSGAPPLNDSFSSVQSIRSVRSGRSVMMSPQIPHKQIASHLQRRQQSLHDRIQRIKDKQASDEKKHKFMGRSSLGEVIVPPQQVQQNPSQPKKEVETRSFGKGATVAKETVERPTVLPNRVTVLPETLNIVAESLRLEGFVEIFHQGGDEQQKATEVLLSSSTPLIRLATTRCSVDRDSTTRVRVMLDSSSSALRKICKKFLSLTASSGNCLLGFVTAQTSVSKQEFNIDVVLSREVCATVVETAVRSSTDSSTSHSSSGTAALQPTVVAASTYHHHGNSETVLQQAPILTTPVEKMDTTRLDSHHLRQRSDSSSNVNDSATTTRLESTVTKTFLYSSEEHVSKINQKVVHSSKTGESKKLLQSKSGVYFRRESAQFGAVVIGSLTRTRIELVNNTNEEVTVFIGDLALPFVLLHNEVRIPPRSYTMVPLRFVPVTAGQYQGELVAQTADGVHHTTINISGYAQ